MKNILIFISAITITLFVMCLINGLNHYNHIYLIFSGMNAAFFSVAIFNLMRTNKSPNTGLPGVAGVMFLIFISSSWGVFRLLFYYFNHPSSIMPIIGMGYLLGFWVVSAVWMQWEIFFSKQAD